MGSYVPATQAETQRMLESIGLSSLEELYATVPDAARCGELDMPDGASEMEVAATLEGMAAKNTVFRSVFRGCGAYKHYIPAIVKTVTGKEEFVTAYTPYQAEISQGVLQSIFEYQTQVCELFGMDCSNASVYDGATAAAEAVLMCQERKRTGVVMAGTVGSQVATVVSTYCASRSVEVDVLEPAADLCIDPQALAAQLAATPAACVLVQSPNCYGFIEDVAAIVEVAHAAKAKVIMSANPISLGLLKTPGELGVDVAVAEGQPLGLPLSFGGPYLGIMCCTKAMMRKLPGRIVGQTQDANGKRCFVLTLQAREQHIRREKASSNICSNEALCAMTASVYLAAMGPGGVRQVAESSMNNAHYLAAQLSDIEGFALASSRPFFNEFLMSCPVEPDTLLEVLAEHGILGGMPEVDGMLAAVDRASGQPGNILWCCTELNRKACIDELVAIVREVCGQ